MHWMISANGKIYDHATAFQRWGFIDWRQRAKYSVGDIVYIYCTYPFMKVMYKAVVENESMTSNEIVDDSMYWYVKEEHQKALEGKYARLRLVQQANSESLSLNHLKAHGLKAAPQGPIKVNEHLSQYIDKHMDDYCGEGIFPDSSIPDDCHEGAVYQVTVNKYERSSIARKKCIDYHGTRCFICNLNFEEKYGQLGKDFIHIHHLVPLNQIGADYIVDYKKDLIPVCPNCHAMLHRKMDGVYIDWRKLKQQLIDSSKQY